MNINKKLKKIERELSTFKFKEDLSNKDLPEIFEKLEDHLYGSAYYLEALMRLTSVNKPRTKKLKRDVEKYLDDLGPYGDKIIKGKG